MRRAAIRQVHWMVCADVELKDIPTRLRQLHAAAKDIEDTATRSDIELLLEEQSWEIATEKETGSRRFCRYLLASWPLYLVTLLLQMSPSDST